MTKSWLNLCLGLSARGDAVPYIAWNQPRTTEHSWQLARDRSDPALAILNTFGFPTNINQMCLLLVSLCADIAVMVIPVYIDTAKNVSRTIRGEFFKARTKGRADQQKKVNLAH